MRYGVYLLVGVLLLGCTQIQLNNDSAVYFGGEIINPKEGFVVLNNEKGLARDTIRLNPQNRFLIRLDSIETGLYSFRHGGEFQMIILEPKDSLMLRLNTYDFDESLVFSGRGAPKNNYLLKIFLQNEREDRRLIKYSQQEPEQFQKFVENRHQNQLEALDDFLNKKDVSAFTKSVLKASIDYNNYADKEIYPFAYFGNNKLVHHKDLPEQFYQHRSEIDYNSEALSEVFAYNRFLFAHIDNLALDAFYAHNDFHTTFNRHQLLYNKAKLDLIDSLVANDFIKNNLLKYKTRDFISHNLKDEEIEDILAYYRTKSTNKDDIADMESLVNAMKNLRPGNEFPNLGLVDIYNKEHNIEALVNKPTLIYFWSSNNKKHYRNSHYRVRELKKNFPNVEFISININEESEEFWIKTLNKYKFSVDQEFKFKDPDLARQTLALNFVYKVMVLDENGEILHPNVNIFSENFESDLEKLLTKKALSI